MAKALTIRTDKDLYKKLDALAKETQRSRNYLANEALRAFLSEREAVPDTSVITCAEDLAGDFWPEDDTDTFLEYLVQEREASLEDDTPKDL